MLRGNRLGAREDFFGLGAGSPEERTPGFEPGRAVLPGLCGLPGSAEPTGTHGFGQLLISTGYLAADILGIGCGGIAGQVFLAQSEGLAIGGRQRFVVGKAGKVVGDACGDLKGCEYEAVENRLAQRPGNGVEGAGPIAFPCVAPSAPGQGEQVVVDRLGEASIQGWVGSPASGQFPAGVAVGLGAFQGGVDQISRQGIEVLALVRIGDGAQLGNGFLQGGPVISQGRRGGAGGHPVRGLGEPGSRCADGDQECTARWRRPTGAASPR